jgi:hypothetical protein
VTIVAKSEPMPTGGGRIEGGSPLAGHLGLASLLVREAVQNSWDARDDERNGPVHFAIDGWDLDTDRLDHLRTLLPVDHLKGFERRRRIDEKSGILHPAAALAQPNVKVLVVSDRNTVGLCGPTTSGRDWQAVREGRPLERGQQRFANFIRNQGRATADIGGGDGGAYGVGKSALWMASTCGTIVVHTRTFDSAGEPVDRVIGSVHGEHFYDGGFEFTGRHFVGREDAEGIIEPLIGNEAIDARNGLPIPPYAIDGRPTYGTSIVIVAPRLNLSWQTEMDRLRDAVRWHVWPKRVPGVRDPEQGPDMEIRLGWNNNPVPVPPPLEDPEIRPYAKALLDCARDRTDSEPDRDHVARCLRPVKVLGALKFREAGARDDNAFHVTLTEREIEDSAEHDDIPLDAIDPEPAIDFSRPWGQIALIRREPLLLVRYEPVGGPDAASTMVGVYLSANDPEVENALTKAEPPAHDDWIHKIVPKDHPKDYRRTFAKRTVEEIRRGQKHLLAAFRSSDLGTQGGGEQAVSRRISEGLFGGLGGGTRPRRPKDPDRAPKKTRAVLTLIRSDQDGAHTVHELNVNLEGVKDGASVVLTATGTAYDSVGSMPIDERVSFEWANDTGLLISGPTLELPASSGNALSLVVKVASDLRVRPRVGVEVQGGA